MYLEKQVINQLMVAVHPVVQRLVNLLKTAPAIRTTFVPWNAQGIGTED